MHILIYISDFIVPFIILAVVIYGLLSGINVYDTFIKGARSGFLTVIRLMPTLIGLMAAVGILRASGFLDFLAVLIGRFSSHIGFPGELIPLTIVKMFSSSAATGSFLTSTKIRDRFSSRADRLDLHVLYRDDLLHNERILYDRRYQKIPVHPGGRTHRHFRRSGGQRISGGRLRIVRN